MNSRIRNLFLRSPLRIVVIAMIVSAGLALPVSSAVAEWFGEFWPLVYESYWTYEKVGDPAVTYTDTVFEVIEYEGVPAVRVGEDMDEHMIASNDMQILTVYAIVEDGELFDLDQNIVLSEFSDGSYFIVCFDAECDTNMIRVWNNIDPALRSIYEVDPQWTDLILIASYDSDYDPNLHNIAVNSNLPDGVTPPAGAVTGLEWIQRYIGPVANRDVDAESGGLEDYYVLVDWWVPPVGVPDRANVITLHQNFPNPFNPATNLAFDLHEAGLASVEVFDLGGRRVRTLFRGQAEGGHHLLHWDGSDSGGKPLPSGSYFYRLEAGGQVAMKKMLLVR